MTEKLSDPAAERAVLAGLFAYGAGGYADLADLVKTDTFTIDSNQTLWACLEHLFKEGHAEKVDYPSVMSAAHTLGVSHLFDKPEEQQHLRGVMNLASMALPIEQATVRRLAGRIRKLEVARLAHRQHALAQDELLKVTGDESVDAILGISERPIADLTSLLSSGSEGPSGIGLGIRAYAEYLAANQRDTVGISSGYKHFDRAIGGGFRPATLNVVGARPKIGKSLMKMNIGKFIASQLGYPVLDLDTEMTKEDQWVRILACESGVKIDDIETGKYANNARKATLVKQAIDKLEKIPYDFISIAGQPFEETLSTMRRWVVKRVGLNDNGHAGPCLIILDYLKLMDAAGMQSQHLAEFQLLGFMMTSLHNFAVRYRVPVLVFIQLNRDGIDEEHTGVASGSDRIVWLCSNFSIYKAKSDEEMADQVGAKESYNRKLVPVAARHGAGLPPGDYIHFQSHGAIARIVEGPTRNGQAQDGTGGLNPGAIVEDTSGQAEIRFDA